MDVKITDLQPNNPVTTSTVGNQPQSGTASTATTAANAPAAGTNAASKMSSADLVTLSTNSIKQSQLSTLMTGFQNSLVDTLSPFKAGSGMGSLYSLVGTPVDNYINQNLNNLTPDMKKSFMDLYTSLANTSGGLVPQSLISQTFGQTGGFSQFLTSLTNRLNQLPLAATPPAGFPATGGTSITG